MNIVDDALLQLYSRSGFSNAERVVHYRGWAADRRSKYKDRVEYDRWAAQCEARVIEAANKIIEWKTNHAY